MPITGTRWVETRACRIELDLALGRYRIWPLGEGAWIDAPKPIDEHFERAFEPGWHPMRAARFEMSTICSDDPAVPEPAVTIGIGPCRVIGFTLDVMPDEPLDWRDDA